MPFLRLAVQKSLRAVVPELSLEFPLPADATHSIVLTASITGHAAQHGLKLFPFLAAPPHPLAIIRAHFVAVATAHHGSTLSVGAVSTPLRRQDTLPRIIGQTIVMLPTEVHAQGTLVQPPRVVQTH